MAPGALSPNLESSHRSTLHAPRGPAGRAASARWPRDGSSRQVCTPCGKRWRS